MRREDLLKRNDKWQCQGIDSFAEGRGVNAPGCSGSNPVFTWIRPSCLLCWLATQGASMPPATALRHPGQGCCCRHKIKPLRRGGRGLEQQTPSPLSHPILASKAFPPLPEEVQHPRFLFPQTAHFQGEQWAGSLLSKAQPL